jgi:hypothetical protein
MPPSGAPATASVGGACGATGSTEVGEQVARIVRACDGRGHCPQSPNPRRATQEASAYCDIMLR